MATPSKQSSVSIKLDYAPVGSRSYRSLRRLALLVGTICLSVSARHFSSAILHCARASYWEYECMYFNPPADLPIRADILPAQPIASPYMQPSYRYCQSDLFPKCYVRYFQETYSWSFVGQELPIFCHERTSPAGEHRLVILKLGGNLTLDGMARLSSEIIEPDFLGGQEIFRSSWKIEDHMIDSDFLVTETLLLAYRIYPGRPDPQNGSHFTIDYEAGDRQRGTIDGWLEDHAVIRVKARPGPIDVKAYRNSIEN